MTNLLLKSKIILSIARYTLLQSIRNKMLYIPLIFALLFILFSIFIGEIAINEQNRFILNISMITIQVISVFLAIVLGTYIFMEEIKIGVLHIFLAKPVSRGQYFFGKYLGGVLTIFINILLMVLLSLGVFYFRHMPITYVYFVNSFMVLLEAMVILALSVLFSLTSSQLLATFCLICLWLIGHTSEYHSLLIQKGHGLAKLIGYISYRIFPDLEKLNYKNEVIYNVYPEFSQILTASLYALLFSGLILLITTLVLNRRDL